MDEKEARECLSEYARVLERLQSGGVVRSYNSPVGDYVEWLAGRALGLRLERGSEKGYDATDPVDGKRYQIKGVWRHRGRKSLQLSPVRNYGEHAFDEMIVVILAENFTVEKALSVPHCVIGDYSRLRSHTNAISVALSCAFLSDPRIKDITELFR